MLSPIKSNPDTIPLEGEYPDNHPEIIGKGYFYDSDNIHSTKGSTKFLFNSIWLYMDWTLLEVWEGFRSSP